MIAGVFLWFWCCQKAPLANNFAQRRQGAKLEYTNTQKFSREYRCTLTLRLGVFARKTFTYDILAKSGMTHNCGPPVYEKLNAPLTNDLQEPFVLELYPIVQLNFFAMKSSILLIATVLFCQFLQGQHMLYVEAQPRKHFPADSIAVFLPISPNPVQDEVLFSWTQTSGLPVTLNVSEASGHLSITLPLGQKEPGSHTKTLGTSALTAGVYVATLRIGQEQLMQRFVVSH